MKKKIIILQLVKDGLESKKELLHFGQFIKLNLKSEQKKIETNEKKY